MPYFWQRSRILSWRTLSISFRIQPPIASLYFPFEDSCALSVDSVHRALIYTDALVPMQNQQARRVGAPPVEEFLVSDGSRAVSRIVDSPEFFEFILRANRSESELMSCVGLHVSGIVLRPEDLHRRDHIPFPTSSSCVFERRRAAVICS